MSRANLRMRRIGIPAPRYQWCGFGTAFALPAMRLVYTVACECSSQAALPFREKQRPDEWSTFNSKPMLGEALLGQHKYADVEPLLLAGYQSMKEREAKIPPQVKMRLTEAIERLVKFYSVRS